MQAEQFRIAAMPAATAEAVRRTLTTPGWGYPAIVELAGGYGPCRTCLRMFEVGVDQRIFFTHDEFAGREPYPLPGPVYICADPCEPYAQTGAFPDDLRALPLTLNAYASGRRLCAQVLVDDGKVEEAISRLFADPAVDYIHVRNTEVGCFLLGVDRVAEEARR